MYNHNQAALLASESTLQKRISTAYWSIVAAGSALLVSLTPAFASATNGDIWTKFQELMYDIYGNILGISTIVAIVAASIALVIRMISQNQHAVESATSWLKRIAITWFVLNTLGFFVAYVQPLVEGGAYHP